MPDVTAIDGPIVFPIVGTATIVTAVWFGGLWYFWKRDKLDGRAANNESGRHVLWACLLPVPLLAYLLWHGMELAPRTGPQLFVQSVLGELLAGSIIFTFHEAVWGKGMSRIERTMAATVAVALFLSGIACTILL